MRTLLTLVQSACFLGPLVTAIAVGEWVWRRN